MAVSLTNANGDPISSFGSGNSAYATGTQTNPFTSSPAATFGDMAAEDKSAPNSLISPRTFGDLADTNTGTSTATVAGSTAGLGYSNDPRSAVNTPRRSGGGMQMSGALGSAPKVLPDGPPAQRPQKPKPEQSKPQQSKPQQSSTTQGPEQPPEPGTSEPGSPTPTPTPSSPPPGRNDEFATGATSGRGTSPSGVLKAAKTLAPLALDAL